MRIIATVLMVVALPAMAQTAVTPPGTGTTVDPYRISTLGHLAWMGDTADSSTGKYYVLLNDIDATPTASWNDAGTDVAILEGFRPIGTMERPFTGDFDGRRYAIRSLVIRRPETDDVGLFGGIGYYGVVHHLGLEGGSVTGRDTVGGLVGANSDGTVTECYSTCLVAGQDYVGGLVGASLSSRARQCHTTGAVVGRNYVGGLVGASFAATQIEDCYGKGSVAGSNYVGGLVGATDSGEEVIRCYARGSVTGMVQVGGLVGSGGAEESYATGSVMGDSVVGGLVGLGSARESYATGSVAGNRVVGGLVGLGDAMQCYAIGAVTGLANAGGLVGQGAAVQCYWNTETSGVATSAGGEGRTTVQMREHDTYVGWSWTFPSPWRRAVGLNGAYPYVGEGWCLLRFLAGVNGTVTGESPQWVALGLDATPVTAAPAFGFVFEQWSDWSTENPRRLHAVDADAELTASFRPAGPAASPAGTLLATAGVAEVGQGRGLWDFTGTYITSVAGYPLTLRLAHDSCGRLTGTAEIGGLIAGGQPASPVDLRAIGSVKGVGGSVAVKLKVNGAGSARAVRVELPMDLVLDADSRRLVGLVAGSIRTAAGTTAIVDTVALALPVSMDGTWTLLFSLAPQGRLSVGTVVLRLSNGVEHHLAASGRSSGQGLALGLMAGATDSAASRIAGKTIIAPLEGGWARLEGISARGYGQVVRW